MFNSLLTLLGLLLKHMSSMLLMLFSLSLGMVDGEGVSPSRYVDVMEGPVGTLSGYSKSLVSNRVNASPDLYDVSISDDGSLHVEDSDSAMSRPHRFAKNITTKIDSLVNGVEPGLDPDSLMNVTIGLPVTERADNRVVEKVNAALSSSDIDLEYDDIERLAMIVTLIITVFCFGIPFLTMIIIIGMILRSRVKYQRERLSVIEKIVLSGREVPEELSPRGSMNHVDRRKNFDSGVKWIASGIVLTCFFGVLTKSFLAVVTFGIVPLMVGAVRLSLFFYDSKLSGRQECLEKKVFPPQFTGIHEYPDHSPYSGKSGEPTDSGLSE